MPVPTPRTIQPLTESDLHEDDHIPEDWKENNNNNENEEVHSESKNFFLKKEQNYFSPPKKFLAIKFVIIWIQWDEVIVIYVH